MNNFRADLHCHSTCSDGTVTPEGLIDLAISTNLSGLSITDHDTVKAYDTAIDYAKKRNLPLIPGVEFSCLHRDVSIHILGYSFDVNHPEIRAFCERHRKRRIVRSEKILEKLRAHDMPLKQDELTNLGNIGRPHIAMAMLNHGYISSIDQAFKLYLAEGKSCYVKGETFTIEESIDVIHKAKGLAIIAHPHLVRSNSVINDMLQMDFDGLEGYYAKFPRDKHEKWIGIANKKDWLITGGSDFHGDVKPHINLGCSWVNQEVFDVLKNHYHNSES